LYTILCVCVYFLFSLCFLCYFPLQLSPSVLWYCWLGLLTCRNRLPYNLYCVGGDVKHCSINYRPRGYDVTCCHSPSSCKDPLNSQSVFQTMSACDHKQSRWNCAWSVDEADMLSACLLLLFIIVRVVLVISESIIFMFLISSVIICLFWCFFSVA